MVDVCVLLADGFEEIEAVTIIDVLRRAEIEVSLLGTRSRDVNGAHGIEIRADATLEEVGERDWAAVILPGGIPGATNLRDDARVKALLQRQDAEGGMLAAICAAPIALSAAGVLEGKEVTSYPGFAEQIRCGAYREDHVVIDRNVTTSRGPGTALEFSLHLVSQLVGEEMANHLADEMLVGGMPLPSRRWSEPPL